MNFYSKFNIALFLGAAFGLAACNGGTSPTTTSVNGNQANISNVPMVGNVNVETNTNANNKVLAGDNAGIEAKEPEQYQATVTLKLESGGTEKSSALPPLTAQVARSGDNKRLEFAMPGGDKVIYLSRGAQQFIIFPQRKQYAELNKEALGIDPRPVMMPEQIVKRIKDIKGVQRVGEEKFGDREVIKYTYNSDTKVNAQPPTANTSNTNTTAKISTDAVVLVDKESGLPLRFESFSASQDKAVAGMNSLRIVTEMSNLKLTTDESLFAEPTDFKKATPEEIKAQADAVSKFAGAFIQQLLNQAGNNQPPTVNSPTPAAQP